MPEADRDQITKELGVTPVWIRIHLLQCVHRPSDRIALVRFASGLAMSLPAGGTIQGQHCQPAGMHPLPCPVKRRPGWNASGQAGSVLLEQPAGQGSPPIFGGPVMVGGAAERQAG